MSIYQGSNLPIMEGTPEPRTGFLHADKCSKAAVLICPNLEQSASTAYAPLGSLFALSLCPCLHVLVVRPCLCSCHCLPLRLCPRAVRLGVPFISSLEKAQLGDTPSLPATVFSCACARLGPFHQFVGKSTAAAVRVREEMQAERGPSRAAKPRMAPRPKATGRTAPGVQQVAWGG